MQAVDLKDEIEIEPTPEEIKIVCDHPGIPTGSSNLAYRAAQFFLDTAGINFGVRIKIKKRIPAAAGLGGGSSNAASVLSGLNELFKTNLSTVKLQRIASQLGSDVPFFLSSGSALATGRGEKLKPLKLPLNYWLVLVNPGFAVSTEWAYSRVKPKAIKQKTHFRGKQTSFAGLLKIIRENGNDLAPAVLREHPQVQKKIESLGKSGALYGAMSGSGPTVFGIFKDKTSAAKAAKHLSGSRSWRTWVVKPIRRRN